MIKILKKWLNDNQFTQEDLITIFLNQSFENILNVQDKNELKELEKRANLFLMIANDILLKCQELKLENQEKNLLNLWNIWLPLALQIKAKQERLKHTFIQGILGGQGTGKTTMTSILKLILQYLGKKTLFLSIDDLYKTYQEREKLRQKKPYLIWRGPPGTHDVQLGIDILEKLRQKDFSKDIFLPRFDKSLQRGMGDRITPELLTEKPDLVLFEGWFLGVLPVDNSLFNNPPWPILTKEAKTLAFESNKNLQEYLPLWEKLDSLIILYPQDFTYSKKWRLEAEQKMMATGKMGMTETEINQFVEYFWQSLHPELFITPLINNPQKTDLVIEIQGDRSIGKIYQPS